MNPIASDAIGSILRWALALAASYLVEHGIWTQAQATTYVAAAALGLLALGWSFWSKYRARVKLLTALYLPKGTSENGMNAHIAMGNLTPSVMTPPDTAPGVPLPPSRSGVPHV